MSYPCLFLYVYYLVQKENEENNRKGEFEFILTNGVTQQNFFLTFYKLYLSPKVLLIDVYT